MIKNDLSIFLHYLGIADAGINLRCTFTDIFFENRSETLYLDIFSKDKERFNMNMWVKHE